MVQTGKFVEWVRGVKVYELNGELASLVLGGHPMWHPVSSYDLQEYSLVVLTIGKH